MAGFAIGSAHVKMRLVPASGATNLPIDFFLTDAQGHVSHRELWSKNVEVLPMNLPRGLSYLELSVKPKNSEPGGVPLFPIVAELDGFEISDIDLTSGL
jgi:hypothetical protein